jgi:dienelactone hydrolase
MEFPGYSLYAASHTDPKQILQDAEKVVVFLRDTLRVPTSLITVLGRSMGSGPAFHVASKFIFKSVVICSGFLSVKAVVSDKFQLASSFVDKVFDNEGLVSLNQSPLLILHGKNDGLISDTHAERIYAKATSKAKLRVFEDMPHNNFSTLDCLVKPILEFEGKVNTKKGP